GGVNLDAGFGLPGCGSWLTWMRCPGRRDADLASPGFVPGRRAGYPGGRDPAAAILGTMAVQRIPCVGAVIEDEARRLLLIKRGHEPGMGLWSIPGGRIEPGESDARALIREVLEETGLAIVPGRLLGAVQRPGPAGAG